MSTRSQPLSSTEGALRATFDEHSQLVTEASALVELDKNLVNDAMAHAAHRTGVCANTSGELTTVVLFPPAAALEHHYLDLADLTLYESEPAAVGTRRLVAELGYMCAMGVEWMAHAYKLWLLDCSALHRCRAGPSLPWRRVTTNEMRMHYVSESEAYFWFEPRQMLRSMPGLHEADSALAISIVKLALITLVAATIWIRADRATSAADWLYRHCVEIAHCVEATAAHYGASTMSVSEDAVLGFLCIVARGGVVLWLRDVLREDDQLRVVVVEIVGTSLSLVHWTARYLLIQPNVFQMSGCAQPPRRPAHAPWRLLGSRRRRNGRPGAVRADAAHRQRWRFRRDRQAAHRDAACLGLFAKEPVRAVLLLRPH